MKKANISNLVKDSDLNTKLATLATKAELNIVKLQTYDFLNVFGNDGFQNMFVYQPVLSMLEFKQDKGTKYIIG